MTQGERRKKEEEEQAKEQEKEEGSRRRLERLKKEEATPAGEEAAHLASAEVGGLEPKDRVASSGPIVIVRGIGGADLVAGEGVIMILHLDCFRERSRLLGAVLCGAPGCTSAPSKLCLL